MIRSKRIAHARVLALFSLILVLDQLTKYLVRVLMSPYKNLPVIPGFFNLVFVMNKGGAFGIWSSIHPILREIVFVSLSIVAIFALIILYWKSNQAYITRFGIAFVLGGAVGNLIDRLRWGMVVDFLDFYLGRFHWPAFNVADTAICIGLGLVFLDLFIINEREKDDKVLSNRKSTG